MLHITRYSIKSESLTPLIKFLWSFESENASINYKLLPTDCIDIILNLSSDMVYETKSERVIAPPFHINGLRADYSYISQTGRVRVMGISFYPFGLFPFVNKSLAHIQNKIVDLHTLSTILAKKLKVVVYSGRKINEMTDHIESILCAELNSQYPHLKWGNERLPLKGAFVTCNA